MNRAFTLSRQIKRKISFRVISTLIIFTFLLFLLAFIDIRSYLNETEVSLDKLTNNIDSYIVSQQLIKNRYAIALELDQLEKNYGIKITWIEKGNLPTTEGIEWIFPFNWP
jgi:hypothetical protein